MENENQTGVVSSKAKLPGLFALLDETILIYKRKFKLFIGIAIIPQLIMLVLAAIIFLVGILGFSSKDLILKVILGIVGFLVVLLFLFFVLWSTTALLYAVLRKGEIGFKESYKKSLPYIIPVFAVGFLSGLISFGGFLLFIIPGIIFTVWFSLVSYIIINENVRGFNALLKSKEYIKGRWWQVFWRFLGFAVLMFVFYLVIALVIAVIARMLPNFGNILEQIFAVVINVIMTPIQMIFGVILYEKIKNAKGDFEFPPSKKTRVISITSFVIIAILGIVLLFFLLGSVGSLFNRSFLEDAKKNTDLMVIQDALNNYYADNGVYPDRLEDLIGNYLFAMPLDPFTQKSYEYNLNENKDNFQICTNLRKEVKCLEAFTE